MRMKKYLWSYGSSSTLDGNSLVEASLEIQGRWGLCCFKENSKIGRIALILFFFCSHFFFLQYLWKIFALESNHLLVLYLLYYVFKNIILWFPFCSLVAYRRDEMWSGGRYDCERLPRERVPPRSHPGVSCFYI